MNISSVTAFGVAVERAGPELPDRRDLRLGHAEELGAADGVRHAIAATGRAARHVRDQPLEAAIDLAVRVEHRGVELPERRHHLRLALHDLHAVGNEAHALPRHFERSRLFRIGRKRIEARGGVGLVHEANS
jgi:hypothetical protein